MHSALLIIFIISAYAIVHSYVVYPSWLIAFTPGKKNKKAQFGLQDNLPEVAILMAAYNEEKVVGEKISSVFNTSYPLEKIRFYIGSDRKSVV